MPTGIYERTEKHLEQIRKIAKSRVGKYRVGYKVAKNGCWLWLGAQDGKGYGHLKRNGKHTKAYRFYYEKKYGKVSEGLELDHLCKNKICCNPDHLEPVTHAVNSRRAMEKHLKKIPIIFSLKNSGLRGSVISRKLKIPERTVYEILRRSRWAHLLTQRSFPENGMDEIMYPFANQPQLSH